MNKALFLDLDGTLIETRSGNTFPKDEKDWNRAFISEYGTHYKEIVSPFLSYGINEKNIKCYIKFN